MGIAFHMVNGKRAERTAAIESQDGVMATEPSSSDQMVLTRHQVIQLGAIGHVFGLRLLEALPSTSNGRGSL